MISTTSTSKSNIQLGLRLLLGAGMLIAGTGHLTFARKEFQAQVPDWVPMDKDMVVVLSGYVELLIGLGLIAAPKKHRAKIGLAVALFYIAVFPGNIAQYVDARSAFGLDTDGKRLARLFFQPVLIAWVLWSMGTWDEWRRKKTLL